MDLKGKLRQGMRIFGADNRDYGTIDRYDDDYVYVGERRIPTSAFERAENDRLHLGERGRQYFETSDRAATEGETRVPVMEERLQVDKRDVELGAVEIRKEVTSEQATMPVELTREQVRVERVDVNDRPVAAGELADAFKEGTIRVPVRGEEAVVNKEAVVTGEVVIERERTTERQNITDTVRKERVDADENYRRDRAALEEHFNTRRSTQGTAADTRTFTDAEPNYRRGYEAAHDERYAGREFEDVEPELRQSHTGSDSWERLREDIRGGWDRARGRQGTTPPADRGAPRPLNP